MQLTLGKSKRELPADAIEMPKELRAELIDPHRVSIELTAKLIGRDLSQLFKMSRSLNKSSYWFSPTKFLGRLKNSMFFKNLSIVSTPRKDRLLS